MIHLNEIAERTKDYSAAADAYFKQIGQANTSSQPESFWHNLARWTLRHLILVGLSLAAAIAIGIPLGIYASSQVSSANSFSRITGLIQTVPVPRVARAARPNSLSRDPSDHRHRRAFSLRIVADREEYRHRLARYSSANSRCRGSAGLKPRTRLLKIFLPLASPSILAGIKTSAIINIGSATLAALIGAGGLGEPIISGLNLNDHTTILEGAIPAALMAIAAQGLFSFWIEP